MKNFHLPLPETTHAELLAAADRAQVAATSLAREAITTWLRARKKLDRRNEIAAYAAQMAGTHFDLDRNLESAAIEHLMKMDPELK